MLTTETKRYNVRAHRTQITFASQPTIFARSGAARLFAAGNDFITVGHGQSTYALWELQIDSTSRLIPPDLLLLKQYFCVQDG